MPQLPEEHQKIIIRPRGRLSLSKVSTMAIGTAVIEASGLMAKQSNEDVVCPYFTQNIVVVSTLEPDNAARRVDIRDSQSAITTNIVHERNPFALAAKRIRIEAESSSFSTDCVCQILCVTDRPCVEGVEPPSRQTTTCPHPQASSVEEATPPETKRAGSGFKYLMWYGPAQGNATGRNQPRRRPWGRQAYTKAPKAAHALGVARDPDAAGYTGITSAPSREECRRAQNSECLVPRRLLGPLAPIKQKAP
ncbi:hypothetical protein HPB51_016696 [Rhipicephalus microplus]|uniref:Uncharacterized protein n=1 Tax=Rhipicephalus microplus TaxID=6941 RepID=A0A9J6D5S9_RHIMP|nr:hypothetical protein HPB51_016696 [Rhipicephalus microplus]